jgi:hypothetical protein
VGVGGRGELDLPMVLLAPGPLLLLLLVLNLCRKEPRGLLGVEEVGDVAITCGALAMAEDPPEAVLTCTDVRGVFRWEGEGGT